jgi:RNA polymerase sigma-70 factor (ECF subfamily)
MQPMPRGRPAEEVLLQRVMFDAVWRIAWESLARLPHADRADLAQEIVIRAWRSRGRYRSARGSPEQWVRIIAKRMAIDFLRKRSGGVPADVPVTLADDAPEPLDTSSPEETAMWSQLAQLADHVLAKLPEGERRALILHELEGHSFAEIAAMEGISPATAHARHARGMAKLKKATEDGTLDSLLVPIAPLVPEDGDGPRSEPPTQEMRDRAWQRFVDAGGLELPPESEPPPSGTRRRGALRKLVPLLALFLGPGLPAPPDEPPATTVAATAVAPTTPVPPAPTAPAPTPTEPITVAPLPAATAAAMPKPASGSSSTPRARPPGHLDAEHVERGHALGRAGARDWLRGDPTRETASR